MNKIAPVIIGVLLLLAGVAAAVAKQGRTLPPAEEGAPRSLEGSPAGSVSEGDAAGARAEQGQSASALSVSEEVKEAAAVPPVTEQLQGAGAPVEGLSAAEAEALIDSLYVPQVPNMLVDRRGYAPAADKVAVFRGRDLPEVFVVRDDATGEPVAEYPVHPVSAEDGIALGWGDFSGLEQPGTYYLTAEGMGESYSFSVGAAVLGDRCDQILRVCRETACGAEGLSHLLFAYEMSGDSFGDSAGLPESGNGVPDILDVAGIQVKGLLSGAGTEDPGALAAALARFSVLAEGHDEATARACLGAARAAYGQIRDTGAGGWRFAAAAELYRATGEAEYHETLARSFQMEGFYERAMGETPLLLGAVTYLKTPREVDLAASERMMGALTRAAEQIAVASNRSVYGAQAAGSGTWEAAVPGLLCGTEVLTVCEHVSYSYEYSRLLAEYLHALCGRNPEGRDYLGEALERGGAEPARFLPALGMLLTDGATP